MKYILNFILVICLISCEKAGTIVQVDNGRNSNIEVFRYYYQDGSFVYVSRFKNSKNVQTTTWTESDGESTDTRANVVIYENDSIKVIKKTAK